MTTSTSIFWSGRWRGSSARDERGPGPRAPGSLRIARAAEPEILVAGHLDVAPLERGRIPEARPARGAVPRQRGRVRRPLEERAHAADLAAERDRAPRRAPLGEVRQPLAD